MHTITEYKTMDNEQLEKLFNHMQENLIDACNKNAGLSANARRMSYHTRVIKKVLLERGIIVEYKQKLPTREQRHKVYHM